MKVNFKYKAIVAIVIILMILLSMKYIKPMYEYQIQDSQIAISKSISKMTGGKPIQIILIEDVDNKRIVLFQRGSEIGELCFASRKCLVLQPKVPSPLASIAVI